MNRALDSHCAIAAGGSVLIAVLWVCLGLVSVTLLFGHSMLMNYRGVDNELAGHQADQAIEGAARYVETLLAQATTPGLLPDPLTYQNDAVPVGEATYWMMGRPADPGDGVTREFGLVDEASKLNLNTATKDMLKELGMTEDLATAIDEWRSQNSGSSLSSSGGVTATTVKHAFFESIEELALVSGMTREILSGEDANLNGVLDPNEDDSDKSPPADNSDGKLDPGILEYLTVFSREPTKQTDGQTDRIDISQLDAVVAMIVQIYPDREAALRQSLQPGPYTSAMDIFARSGIQSVLSGEEFDKIAPNLTWPNHDYPTDPTFTGVGLINVNTAGESVLQCVPGLQDKATGMVSERLNRGTSSTGLAWAARLLTPAEITAAGPYLTGSSYQVSADIAAVGRHGRGYRREKMVIDHQVAAAPKIIYRRNLAPLGWALGSAIRQSLALKKEVR